MLSPADWAGCKTWKDAKQTLQNYLGPTMVKNSGRAMTGLELEIAKRKLQEVE